MLGLAAAFRGAEATRWVATRACVGVRGWVEAARLQAAWGGAGGTWGAGRRRGLLCPRCQGGSSKRECVETLDRG